MGVCIPLLPPCIAAVGCLHPSEGHNSWSAGIRHIPTSMLVVPESDLGTAGCSYLLCLGVLIALTIASPRVLHYTFFFLFQFP